MKPINHRIQSGGNIQSNSRLFNYFKSCGSNVIIEDDVTIINPENIILGDDVHLRRGCMIYAQSSTSSENMEHIPYIVIGDGVHIKENAILNTYGGFIKLGKNVNIGQNSVIYGNGGVVIGDDSGIGPLSMIIASNHNYSKLGIPFRLQGETKRGVRIGNNVWCAGHVSICDGVCIGENSVIGAGSVVRKSVPPNAVVMGNPAQIAFIRK